MQNFCGFTPAIDADATVYKSDTIITSELRDKLRAAATPLEDVLPVDQDWHPDSDEKVLDLVHPSLFPLLYGRSRVLKPEYGHVLNDNGEWNDKTGTVSLDDCELWIGKGGIMPVPEPASTQINSFPGRSEWRGHRDQHFYSTRFQWLPCEVAFTDDHNRMKITSYINNLQPGKYKDLYKVLEQVISRVVPMWNATLDSTERERRDPRIDINHIPWNVPEGAPEHPAGGATDESWDILEKWVDTHRTLVTPEPEPYSVRQKYTQPDHLRTKPVDLRKDFADHGLQVIVKLANIHLTPEKPEYGGGSWHIEGQLNEHICASALYYYDSENISDSYLSFRQATDAEWLEQKPYEQNDHEHLSMLYGVESSSSTAQELGSVLTRENRVLTFPNVLQHRVSPFALADKTRPGHRKILALFLVDPYTRIPSTANVPPQQKEWWREMVYKLDRIEKLPIELREWVMDSAGDFPIELEEAKRLRLELMEERKMFVEDHETRLEDEYFSFCEH